ncbi:zf-TFIIB domain-containing protein [Paraflavisolibacter sp. H34]|uniref:TFIIB-type zinc ribbon-containing protein n=1 Tax=Huijunlia imazamoxiresistens TaxID=3127457 RepID=UPI003015CFCE
MKCPNCNEDLVMSERQGVEIDYCPHCRGVWLDRGELDKIIERSATYRKDDNYRKDDKYYGRPSEGGYHDPHNPHKKKKGFLSDFFDFD